MDYFFTPSEGLRQCPKKPCFLCGRWYLASMLDLIPALCVAFVIFVTSGIAAMMGYGMAVLAIPFCSFFLDVGTLVPLLAVLSGFTSTYIAQRERAFADKKQLKTIFLWVGMGFPAGLYSYYYLPKEKLTLLLGIFITGVAIQGLWNAWHGRKSKAWPRPIGRCLLILGGLIQGAFATGGPPIVAYVEPELRDKRVFRATLVVLWSVLDITIAVIFFLSARRDIRVLLLAALCIPSIFFGVYVGQKLHEKVSEDLFRKAVFSLLLIAGITRIVHSTHGKPEAPTGQPSPAKQIIETDRQEK